jgi:hypothetical protein
VRERKGRRIAGAIDGKPFLSAERYNRGLLLRRDRVDAPYDICASDWKAATIAAFGIDFAEQPID